jgi:SAM-dependent methyltransferase
METPQQGFRVANYFDKIADDYSSRYGDENPFHNYFFRRRLEIATANFAFSGKSILDIGAGTGALYEELIRRFPSVDYFACDISPRMLAQSPIPPERTFVGPAPEIRFPRERFDFIFSLGVTTYQTPTELSSDWRFIADHLAPNGTAIISITNRGSIDHMIRTAMKVTKPLIRNGVFGQPFSTYAYRVDTIKKMAHAVGLRIASVKFLNQTFSPFNTLLPGLSVRLAKIIERAPVVILPPLSADFIVFAERS